MHELIVNNEANIILRDNRIVPTSALAHERHQGFVKLLHEKVWFQGIDKCIIQVHGMSKTSRHIADVSSACIYSPCGLLWTLFLQESTSLSSRFAEVEIIHSTSAKTTIPKLDQIFSTHGIPKVVWSDNGSLLPSEGLMVSIIIPLWPKDNSEAENFMKPITKAILSANTEGPTSLPIPSNYRVRLNFLHSR